MEGFENQRVLLEYLGRNPEDRKWVKRRMEEGLIRKEDGMFYLSDKIDWVNYKASSKKEEKKSESKVRVEIDDSELKELKDKNEKLMNAYKKERDRNLVYRGMYDHLVFFYNKFLGYKKFVEGKVFGQAEHNKSLGTQDTMETVRPGVYERYNFEFGEVEEEECKAVEAIINERGNELAEIPF